MSSNASRVVLALGAALAVEAGAQTPAIFQNDVLPTAGYTGVTDVTITVQDDGDDDPTAHYDSNTYLSADGFSARQSMLIRFALDGGALPPGSPIDAVELVLFVQNETFTGFSAYQVLRPWDPGEATFLEARANQPWAVAGAAGIGTDRNATPFATFGHFDAGAYAPIAVSDAGVDLVRKWAGGGAPNNGIVIQDYDSWDKLAVDSSRGANKPLLKIRSGPDTYLVPPAADSFIAYEPPSYEGWGLGLSGRDAGRTSSLIRFDVRAIPPGAKVLSASMLFTVNRLPANPAATPFDVYPALVPWTEDATWRTYNGSDHWSAEGAQGLGSDHGGRIGNFPPTCNTSESLCPVGFASLATAVQQWVDDPARNQGLLLQNYTNDDDLQLIDSEWPVAGRRPKLTVQFSWDAGGPGLYPAYAEVYPGETVPMRTFGGAPPYRYSVSGVSGATIDDGGIYRAGVFAGRDDVRAVDQAGAEALATLIVLGNASAADGGSPVSIAFPDPPDPVPPQGGFGVIAEITNRAPTPVDFLTLTLSGRGAFPADASKVDGGRLPGAADAGFLVPPISPGTSLRLLITGSVKAAPTNPPSVTATLQSGPAVVASATVDLPLTDPPPIETGCGCGAASGGLGFALLAGILQMLARRSAARRREAPLLRR